MKSVFALFSAAALAVTLASAQTSPNPQSSAIASPSAAAAASSSGSESTGTIVEFVPGTDIVINTGGTEPVRFKLGNSVTYMNASGKPIDAGKMKKDRRVHVQYHKEGSDLMADQVAIARGKSH